MPRHCCVVGCFNNNKKNKGTRFFRIPTDGNVYRKWVQAIKREDWNPTDWPKIRICKQYVCSDHFVSGKCKLIYSVSINYPTDWKMNSEMIIADVAFLFSAY